jgi:hypothetical protein
MPSLSDIQASMAEALLAPEGSLRALPDDWFAGSAVAGLRVHRNTIVGACCQALRLSYPSVDRLLGTPLFDALAADFARLHPPAAAMLCSYGEDFAEFLGLRSAPEDRALLTELARFDWLFESVAMGAADDFEGARALMLDGGVVLQLATSLKLFNAQFAVDELRAGASGAALPVAPRTLALWRLSDGVAVQAVSLPAATWLTALLQGASLEAALHQAGQVADTRDLALAIANEIFRASFVRLSANQGKTP